MKNHEILAQKRSSNASGKHKTRKEKNKSKYKQKWKRGEE